MIFHFDLRIIMNKFEVPTPRLKDSPHITLISPSGQRLQLYDKGSAWELVCRDDTLPLDPGITWLSFAKNGELSKPAQPLLPVVVPDAVAADAESIAAADGLPEAASDAPATTSPQAPQAVEYRGSAPDACSDIQERLKAMGARWRQFARWCEAHGVQLPETGSGREAYNEVCAAVLADAELMEAFHRELKLN